MHVISCTPTSALTNLTCWAGRPGLPFTVISFIRPTTFHQNNFTNFTVQHTSSISRKPFVCNTPEKWAASWCCKRRYRFRNCDKIHSTLLLQYKTSPPHQCNSRMCHDVCQYSLPVFIQQSCIGVWRADSRPGSVGHLTITSSPWGH